MGQEKNTSNVVEGRLNMSQQPPLIVLQDWLDSYLNFELLPAKNIFWLDTMKYLCQRFKDPQKAYKTVHVAGSKGKGSVSIMMASVLKEAGFTTGLYTSPHITNFEERISLTGQPFSDKIYEESVLELMPLIDSIIPEQLPEERSITWFELVTTYAFLTFRKAKCQWAVFETGMGGRLDATNVIQPEICIITPIELEHIEFLGDTIEKIAAEKAGIIKPGIPVCIATQQEKAMKVFLQVAKEKGCPVFTIEEMIQSLSVNFTNKNMEITINSPIFSRPLKTNLSLLGKFQAQNACLVAIAAKTLFPSIDESIIERGLAKAKLPGRFEIIGTEDNPIILDGAHTEQSIMFSLETLQRIFPNKNKHLLFACAADKNIEKIAPLFTQFDNITLTCPGERKASDPERMKAAFAKAGLKFQFIQNCKEAIKLAKEKSSIDKSTLLVIGSFYLLAEFKSV